MMSTADIFIYNDNMKKIILTGANGFIGRHSIPFLIEKNYEVHAIFNDTKSNFQDFEDNDNLIWHQCNLLDLKEQKKLFIDIQPTYLLHFAWYTTPREYWTSLENLRWVQASIGLIMNFEENGGKRMVLAGTCAEYDWNYGYLSEHVTPLRPTTLYGTCKNSLRDIALQFSNETCISYAWGRIFYLYGPFENSLRIIPYVINSLLSHKYANCTDGNQIRDFLYVKDVASAFVELLDSNVEGSINIASGEPITLREIIYEIANRLDKQELIKFGSIEHLDIEPPILLANVDRLKKDLEWKPKYTLDRGLNDTIKWWREKYNKKNIKVIVKEKI